jgi:hypothetical protein
VDTGVPVVNGEYVKFSIHFNTYTDTGTVYINDVLTNAVDVPFDRSTGNLGVIGFESRHVTDVGGSALWYLDNVSIKPIPEPSTMLLLGAGLIGWAGTRRKMKK